MHHLFSELVKAAVIALVSVASPHLEPQEPGERMLPGNLGTGQVRTLAAEMSNAPILKDDAVAVRRERNGARGEWTVPGRGASRAAHSGEHYAINRWGDTRMGIGFREKVVVEGAWVSGQASPGAWADGVRVIGFRAGVEVGRTKWFEPLARTPRWFAMGLIDVDRVVFEARPVLDGAGWFAIDDFTFERFSASAPEDAQRVVIDFEDLTWGSVLTGSGHAGLDWEVGAGTFEDSPRTISAPRVPTGHVEAPVTGPSTSASTVPGGGTLPGVTNGFFGMRMFESGTSVIPPDSCGAIGRTQFVSVVNSKLAVFDRVTGARTSEITLADLFGPLTLGDPRVTYDHHAGRWFTICSSGPSTARLYMAISLTEDANGAWYTTHIDAAVGADGGRWPDYPTLGFDQHGYYIAALMVPSTMTIWAIDKTPLLAATPSLGTVTAWRNLPFEGAIQPCVTFGDSGGELLVSRRDATRLRVRQIVPPMTAPTMSTVASVVVPSNSRAPSAPALGSTADLATGDTRPLNAVFRDGSIYTAHTINVNGRAACRWYEVDVASGLLAQMGTISDPVRSYCYPAISVNAEHHMVLGFSGSHAGQYAGAYYTGRNAYDAPGVTAPPAVLRAGAGPYNHVDGNGIARWGDYSLTSVDPLDDAKFWTIQEYARVNNRWGTWIAEVEFANPCPSPWLACFTTPNSAGAGARIAAEGGTSVAANALRLTVTDGVPLTNGIFLMGSEAGWVPAGNGLLCLGGAIYRLPLVALDLTGSGAYSLDLSDPSGPGGRIMAGSTWTFQFWYRDSAAGGAGFDFSDAVCATFCP